MIKCIIIDDEYPARILLKEFIERVPTLQLLGSFKSGLEALPTIQNGDVDLIFLDIQMPDITGISFVKMLIGKKPLVIFTTAYSEYAIESYQLDVLDYLLKPFSFDRFLQAIGKAIARQAPSNQVETNTTVVPESQESNDYIIVKSDRKYHRIRLDSIITIEGLREYVTIYLKDGKIITHDTLKYYEESLPASMFIRVSKSHIVRIDLIRSLSGNQISVEGIKELIPIGKQYIDTIKKKLFTE